MFSLKARKARIVLSPFSGQAMVAIGNVLADSVRKRVQKGLDANDQPAKGLAPSYATGQKPDTYFNRSRSGAPTRTE